MPEGEIGDAEEDAEEDVVMYTPAPKPLKPLQPPFGQHALPHHGECMPVIVPVGRGGEKRTQYPLRQKVSYMRRMDALKYTQRQAAIAFGIPRGTLRDWVKHQDDLENQYFSATSRGYADQKKDRPLVKWAKLGVAAYEFLIRTRDDMGQAVVGEDIISYCEGISKEFLDASEEAQSLFFSKWRRLYRLVSRVVSGTTQFLPANWEKVLTAYYGKVLYYKMGEVCIIIHLDETFMPFESVAKRTLEHAGAKRVRIKTTGQDKEGCTVLLGGIYVKKTKKVHRLPPLFGL